MGATPRSAGKKTPRYLYVAGVGYSGSTLLSMLLATHPDVSSVGELTGPSPVHAVGYPCSCGEKVAECAFWRRVGEGMRAAGYEFSPERFGTRAVIMGDRAGKIYALPTGTAVLDSVRDRVLAGVGTRLAQAPEAAARCATLARVITEVDGTTTFVDTSKEWAQIAHLARRPDVDLSVLHLIRDGRAVTRSIMRHKPSRTPADAAAAWVNVNRRVERAVRAHVPPERVMRLRYEDLCAGPGEALGAVARFLDLPDEFQRGSLDPADFHVLGNAMRTRPVDEIVCDDSWRRTLTAADLEAFERTAGWLNRRYGYGSSGPVSTTPGERQNATAATTSAADE